MNDKQQLAAMGDELRLTDERAKAPAEATPQLCGTLAPIDDLLFMANRILESVRDALEDAYGNAMPVCCGSGNGFECCGCPEPEWSPEDQRIMDVLSPIYRDLNAMLAAAPKPDPKP